MATSVSTPVIRCQRPSPTTTSATSGSVQHRNCGESTLLQTVKTSTQASAATGMYWGAARRSERRRQISTYTPATRSTPTHTERRATSWLPGPDSDCEPKELPEPMPQAPRAAAIR